MEGGDRLLPKTSLTLLAAAAGEGSTAAAAREEFAALYYKPVHAYLTAIVKDAEKAADLTQDFFTQRVATGQLLDKYNRAKRFRPYLKQALRNHYIDSIRQGERRPKTGLQPDADSRGWDQVIAEVFPSPEQEFDRAWVRTLVAETLEATRAQCEAEGQHEHVALFVGYYLSDLNEGPQLSWRELGDKFELSEKAARERAQTVARRFRIVLREKLVLDVGAEQRVEEEIAELLEIF